MKLFKKTRKPCCCQCCQGRTYHASSTSTYIFIEDYRINMSIGVRDREKREKQPVSMDLYAEIINDNTSDSDDIKRTVSYSSLVKDIDTIASKGHIDLLETLAERIATKCLNYHRVLWVRVAVSKPQVYRHAERVGITITRKQGHHN